MRNYVVLHRVKEEKNIIHTIRRWEANWNGHILSMDCLIKLVIEGRIEMVGRQERRSKQLLNDIKKTRRCWKLKEDILDRTLCTTHFVRGSAPVLTDYEMNE